MKCIDHRAFDRMGVTGQKGAHRYRMWIGIMFVDAMFYGEDAGFAYRPGRAFLLPCDMGGHARVDRTDNQCRDLGALWFQFGANAIRGRTGRKFRGAISAHIGNCDNSTCGQYVDDCAAAIGFQYRCESTAHRDHTDIIGFDFLPHCGHVIRAHQGDVIKGAGIVHQQIQIRTLCGSFCNLLAVGNVQLDRYQPVRCRLCQFFGVGQFPSGDKDPFGTGIEKLFDKAFANPAISAGDQRCTSFDFHYIPPLWAAGLSSRSQSPYKISFGFFAPLVSLEGSGAISPRPQLSSSGIS